MLATRQVSQHVRLLTHIFSSAMIFVFYPRLTAKLAVAGSFVRGSRFDIDMGA